MLEMTQKVNDARPTHKPSAGQPVRSGSDLAVGLNGEATAIGDNTSADATLFVRAYDRGAVQVAFGTAWLAAVSVASTGQTAYAASNGFVEFAGADYSYTSTQKLSGGGGHEHGTWMVERSRTDFIALNVAGWDVPLGTDDYYGEADLGAWQQVPSVNGNLARFHIDAKAFGDDSFVRAGTMSLALEGYSSSTASVMAGVGSDRYGAMPILRGDGADIIFTSQGDTFVNSGAGDDLVTAGSGDDWIILGAGRDLVFTGAGSNTVISGAGNDVVTAGKGDDWVTGGDGKDMITVGSGNNIVNGGEGNDTIIAGSGDDVIIGGMGNDMISAGDGRNVIRMGIGGTKSDGDDTITSGCGQDLFLLEGSFGRDTVRGFSLDQGDRLVIWDDHDASASLARSKLDPLDLVVTLGTGPMASILTLDNFFLWNADYASPFSRAPLTEVQKEMIRQDMFMDGTGDQVVLASKEYFAIGDYLGLLG